MKLLLLIPLIANADSLSAIVGPVTATNTSPWAYYDKAEAGNINDVVTAALTHTPQIGAAASGTFALADGCTITLTGAGASGFSPGDTAVVAWTNSDGIGQGRYKFLIGTIVGNVMTSSNQCLLPPAMPAETGLTVYHCNTNCSVDTGSPLSYSPSWWFPYPGDGWNFYDLGFSIYRYYIRTNNPTDLGSFRNFTDLWYTWGLNAGGIIPNWSIGLSLTSQFVRALDGHSERFLPLYTMIKSYSDAGGYPITPLVPASFFDNRFVGYWTLFKAVGARADPDATRHAWYCTSLATDVQAWHDQMTSLDSTHGYWMEKSGNYPYRLPSVSPWRMFAVNQALARAYDVLNDTTAAGCNNTAKAAVALSTFVKSANFVYDYGRASNRGVYYDVIGPNNGELTYGPVLGAGTVSVAMGSTALTGSGTSFLTDFAGGTKYIGIEHSDSMAWTHRVVSVADNTHATLQEVWENPGGGATGATTNAVGETYYITPAAPTNCNGITPTCFSLDGTNNGDGTLKGDRDSVMDLIWTMGWAYKTLNDAVWKTRGDELFSSAFGGPVAGPGDGYPGAAGPCGGPACDGTEIGYKYAMHACAVDATLPCVRDNDSSHTYYGNAYFFQGKRFNQGSGIGGADNYLAWRLTTPPAVTGFSISFLGGIKRTGGIR